MSVFIEIQLESRTLNKASLETPERVNPASVARRSISQPENQKKCTKYDIIMVNASPATF